jgi:hypothetical protein
LDFVSDSEPAISGFKTLGFNQTRRIQKESWVKSVVIYLALHYHMCGYPRIVDSSVQGMEYETDGL